MSRLRSSTRDCSNPPRTMRGRSVLKSMPGMGPITAAAIEAFAPPMATFKRGPRLCRLARSRPSATRGRREAEAGTDVKDGAARHPPAPDHRRHDRRQMGLAQGRGQGVVAGPKAGREAALGGGHRPGQQDGPLGLGDAQQGRRLSRISAGAGLIGGRLPLARRDEGGRGPVRANRSDRSRPGKAMRVNELKPLAVLICAWSAYLHAGPRHVAKPHFEA